MSSIFRDPTAGWAALLIVLLPLLIIGAGELEERLRQRDSTLQRPVSILRSWVIPLLAVWALVRVVFDRDASSLVARSVASAFLISVAAAALATLSIVVANYRDRPRVDGARSVPRLLLALPRLLIMLVAAWLLIAGVWDVDLSAALTALGVTSLVISFALQDTLGGLASGFTLLADQPFKPGDWIDADDLEGRVVDVNWRSTRIQTRNGDLVVIPNGQLAGATITNFDEPTRLHRVVVSLQVAYANSPTAAKEMLLAAARSTPGVLPEPPPRVLIAQIDDPLMGYNVQMWVDDYAIAPRVMSDFGSLVWYHSHRMGVPLPSPAQDLYLWDGVRNSEAGIRDHASLLRGLRISPLFDQLGDDELDELAEGVTPSRFAVGETILATGDDDLVLVEHGIARLELVLPGDRRESVAELVDGDVVGMIDSSEIKGNRLELIATRDCDVLTVGASAAGSVISRSPGLTAALDQVATSRRRRVLRLLRKADEGATSGPADTALGRLDEGGVG